MMIRLSKEFNCRVHIVHLSFAGALDIIQKAKAEKVKLTVETAQHYLFFSAEEITEGATAFKCAPPVREKLNNEKLWTALKGSLIDFVATDHSPAPPEMKEILSGDFMKAWGGIASVQLALPALWTAAIKHNATLSDISGWLCAKPALLPQLKNKGRIAKGYDADFVAWAPEEKFTVRENELHHKHKITPYLGKELYGAVKQTWLRGEKLYDDGKFLHLDKGRIIYHE
jgi:allantoinase